MAQQGLVDPSVAAQRVLESADIANREELAAQPDPMQQHMQQIQIQSTEASLKLQIVEIDLKLAEIEEKRTKALKNMADAETQDAKLDLEEMKLQLSAMKDGIKLALDRRLGGMAGSPGGFIGSQGSPAVFEDPEVGAFGNVLDGQAPQGGIPAGASDVPGGFGGLV